MKSTTSKNGIGRHKLWSITVHPVLFFCKEHFVEWGTCCATLLSKIDGVAGVVGQPEQSPAGSLREKDAREADESSLASSMEETQLVCSVCQSEEFVDGAHLQIMMRTDKQLRLNSMRKLLRDTPRWDCHIEGCSKIRELRDYVTDQSKTGVLGPVFATGEPVLKRLGKQGERSDIAAAAAVMTSGGTMGDLLELESGAVTIVRYGQGLRDLANIVTSRLPASGRRNRVLKRKILWIYGPTGTGKTTFAWDLVGDSTLAQIGCAGNGKEIRFDAYAGQRFVLFDDLRPNQIPWTELLQLLQPFPYTGGARYFDRDWLTLSVIITSSLHPRDFAPDAGLGGGIDEDPEQLVRRCSGERGWILHVTGNDYKSRRIGPWKREFDGMEFHERSGVAALEPSA